MQSTQQIFTASLQSGLLQTMGGIFRSLRSLKPSHLVIFSLMLLPTLTSAAGKIGITQPKGENVFDDDDLIELHGLGQPAWLKSEPELKNDIENFFNANGKQYIVSPEKMPYEHIITDRLDNVISRKPVTDPTKLIEMQAYVAQKGKSSEIKYLKKGLDIEHLERILDKDIKKDSPPNSMQRVLLNILKNKNKFQARWFLAAYNHEKAAIHFLYENREKYGIDVTGTIACQTPENFYYSAGQVRDFDALSIACAIRSKGESRKISSITEFLLQHQAFNKKVFFDTPSLLYGTCLQIAAVNYNQEVMQAYLNAGYSPAKLKSSVVAYFLSYQFSTAKSYEEFESGMLSLARMFKAIGLKLDSSLLKFDTLEIMIKTELLNLVHHDNRMDRYFKFRHNLPSDLFDPAPSAVPNAMDEESVKFIIELATAINTNNPTFFSPHPIKIEDMRQALWYLSTNPYLQTHFNRAKESFDRDKFPSLHAETNFFSPRNVLLFSVSLATLLVFILMDDRANREGRRALAVQKWFINMIDKIEQKLGRRPQQRLSTYLYNFFGHNQRQNAPAQQAQVRQNNRNEFRRIQ